MITPSALVLAGLAAVPLRIQTEVGTFGTASSEPWGKRAAHFLDDFAPTTDHDVATDVAFGLTVSALAADLVELGASIRRYAGRHAVSVRDLPEIAQRQETTLYPLLATAGLRGGGDFVKLAGGGGLGVAFAEVRRRGYLDDGEGSNAALAWRLYAGLTLQLPAGLDVGGQLAFDAFELPSTEPLMPIEGDRGAATFSLCLTVAWQGDLAPR